MLDKKALNKIIVNKLYLKINR